MDSHREGSTGSEPRVKKERAKQKKRRGSLARASSAAASSGVTSAVAASPLPESELIVCEREMAPLFDSGDSVGVIALLSRVQEVHEHWLCRLAVRAAVTGDTALLEAVVRRPFCPAHVTQQLRTGHSPLECVQLASAVLRLFEAQLGVCAEADDRSEYGLADAVMAWTASVLDAHYVWLVTSEDEAVTGFLQRLADWQNRQERGVAESLKTITLLDEMVSSRANHKPPPSGYCVETIRL